MAKSAMNITHIEELFFRSIIKDLSCDNQYVQRVCFYCVENPRFAPTYTKCLNERLTQAIGEGDVMSMKAILFIVNDVLANTKCASLNCALYTSHLNKLVTTHIDSLSKCAVLKDILFYTISQWKSSQLLTSEVLDYWIDRLRPTQ